MTDFIPELEVEETLPELTLADDELLATREEDDAPEKLVGEPLERDELDYDPEAELPYDDEDEVPDDGDPGT